MKLLLTAALAATSATSAFAQGAPDSEPSWRILAGPAVLTTPQYPGSEDYRILPIPAFDIRYGDKFYINPAQGIGVKLWGDDAIKLYGGVNYSGGRDEDADLRGLPDVKGGAALFAEAEFAPFAAPLTFTGRVERVVTGDVEGSFATLGANLALRPADKLIVTLGSDAEFGDEDALNALFGISPAESLITGFAPYQADGGLHSVGLNVFGVYQLNDRWSLFGTAFYDRLSDDLQDSAVVSEANQFTSIIGAFYRF